MHLTEIREAIAVEQEKQRSTYIFKVARATRINSRLATIKVAADDEQRSSDTLSESMEAASAWWPLEGGRNGEARVLSVFPEDNELHLTGIQGELPEVDARLRIYPPDFIKAVRKIYYSPDHEEAGLTIFKGLTSRVEPNQGRKELPLPDALPLRERQKDALRLPYLSHALLIGPPGTGKTFSLAAIIAQFLLHEPNQRVLLLSNSNAAVDDAIVKVDAALEKLGDRKRNERCVRIGSNFAMGRYEGREHLLPSSQKLTEKLKTLEKKKPDQKDAAAYDAWLTQYNNVRQEIDDHTRALINKLPLVATTASSASFRFEQLLKAGFDWLVFDEASQVSLYQTIALLPLGKRYLFCGDDRQLPPVCVAHQNTQAKRWIGKSIFSKREKFPQDAIVELNEQNRMVKKICELVSQQFYVGRLVNEHTGRGKKRKAWFMERKLVSEKHAKPIEVIFVEETSRWMKRFMGEVRMASANKAVEIYQTLAEEREALGSDAVILAPLHSQLRLIRETTRKSGISTIPCSTIHKAQGQEYHTVILDVINLSGSNRFLTETLSKEMINVAFSRAKARLVILAHESDLNCRFIKAAHAVTKPKPPQYAENYIEASDINEYAPVGEHNIDQIKGKLYRLTLKNGSQIIIEPTGIRDRYLKAIRHRDGEETEYALQIINGG
ncbi:DEAD/DEAH box helicase [Billgrantia lactosivorans]|uniref:DEAD/DEAH box helicase n=1 Tax=Billgrantia lactosivorans TaxID=2185141 RepID=UPI000DADAC4A|nr:AAA domain-containing protein [Halomonas lactosivorans]